MANVCVITGGGSGLGLATAKNTDKSTILVLAGRTEDAAARADEVPHLQKPREIMQRSVRV